MKSMLLPSKWETERLRVNDSTLDEVPELQQINDAIPQLRGWMGLGTQDGPADPIQAALVGDVLLPPNGSKELARLQSIRLRRRACSASSRSSCSAKSAATTSRTIPGSTPS